MGGEGGRRSAAQKDSQYKQQPKNSDGCPAEGGPAEGPRRVVSKVGAPKGGASFPDLEKVGPRRVGRPKISRFCFPLSPPFSFFVSLSLGVVSWNWGGVLVGRDPQMCA